ncbi:MAG: hypothetical protein RL151_892, partial [Bacteroidota bacterium]
MKKALKERFFDDMNVVKISGWGICQLFVHQDPATVFTYQHFLALADLA